VVDRMATRPAQLVGLAGRKGALAAGCDADLVVFEAAAEFLVTPHMLQHRHKVTPYVGRTLRGRVERAYLRGQLIYDAGRFAEAPRGRTILRAKAGGVPALNGLSEPEARKVLLRCCGAARWAEQMSARLPFAGETELLADAVEVWQGLTREDWLEAFAAHPKIGDLEALRLKFAPAAPWSAEEQGGVTGAPPATLQALAEGNRQYEARFGHIFIVCATGKSAGEMLALLRERLANTPEAELRVAAAEQEKITRLRLQRLLS
jgi:OHCU decarboxylase